SDYSAERLMSAALELFSRKDFNAVTIKDIAAASDVNTALIYYYYESKEDLFRAAIEFAISKAMERSQELREKHNDPIYLINEWFRSNLEVATVIRQLVKIMLDYAGADNSLPSVDKLIKEFYRVEEGDILAGSIDRGISQGVFRNVDSASIANFVSVHLDGIMVASMIRAEFKIEKALSDLRGMLWHYLEHEEKGTQRRRVEPVIEAVQSTPRKRQRGNPPG